MAERAESQELAVITPAGTLALLPTPAAAVIVLRQTPNAAVAAEEFFKATLNNEHTRRAYARITGRFLSWADERRLELRQITPGLACERIRREPVPSIHMLPGVIRAAHQRAGLDVPKAEGKCFSLKFGELHRR